MDALQTLSVISCFQNEEWLRSGSFKRHSKKCQVSLGVSGESRGCPESAVGSGGHNKAPLTEGFTTSPGGCKSEVRGSAGLLSSEASLGCVDAVFSLHPHVVIPLRVSVS